MEAGVSSDPGVLWASFSSPASSGSHPSVLTPQDYATTPAGYASLSVTATISPGATETLSIIWAWHFPHKDWFHAEVGNWYANLWEDSVAVADELASPGRLASVISDINSHHSVLLGPPSDSGLPVNPIPTWLKDTLLNQFSHFRSMHWTANGRMREYEANDCPGAFCLPLLSFMTTP